MHHSALSVSAFTNVSGRVKAPGMSGHVGEAIWETAEVGVAG